MPSPVNPVISASGSAHRRIKSAIYVLPSNVAGRPLADHSTTVLYPMIQRYRSEILTYIPAFELDIQAYEAERLRNHRSLRPWFNEFVVAYVGGAPTLPTRRRSKGGGYVQATHWPRSDWSDIMWTVASLIDAGSYGITQGELKDLMNSDSNGPTGALSDLHAAGLIARLEEKR